MSKIADYVAIVRGAFQVTKTVVNEGVGMVKELGGMVGQVKELIPKRKKVEEEKEPDDTGEDDE